MPQRNDITKSRILRIIEGFNALDGFITIRYVAQELFCDRETAKKHIGMYEETRKAFYSKHEERYDIAEEIMFEMSKNSFAALRYVLESKCKNRGWSSDTPTIGSGQSDLLNDKEDNETKQIGLYILTLDQMERIRAIERETTVEQYREQKVLDASFDEITEKQAFLEDGQKATKGV